MISSLVLLSGLVATAMAHANGAPFCVANQDNFDTARSAMNRPYGAYIDLQVSAWQNEDEHDDVWDPNHNFNLYVKKGARLRVKVYAWSDTARGIMISAQKGGSMWDAGEPVRGFTLDGSNPTDVEKATRDFFHVPSGCMDASVQSASSALTHTQRLPDELPSAGPHTMGGEFGFEFNVPDDFEGHLVFNVISLTGRRTQDQRMGIESFSMNVTDTPAQFPGWANVPGDSSSWAAATPSPFSDNAPATAADTTTALQGATTWYPANPTTVPWFHTTAVTSSPGSPSSGGSNPSWHDSMILETFEDFGGDLFTDVYDTIDDCSSTDARLAVHTFVDKPNNAWKRQLSLLLGLELGEMRDVEGYSQYEYGDLVFTFAIDDADKRCDALKAFDNFNSAQRRRLYLSPNAIVIQRNANHVFRRDGDSASTAAASLAVVAAAATMASL